MDFIATEKTPARTEALLAWHRPSVQRLTVSLDTKFELGSFTDFEGGYSEVMLQG